MCVLLNTKITFLMGCFLVNNVNEGIRANTSHIWQWTSIDVMLHTYRYDRFTDSLLSLTFSPLTVKSAIPQLKILSVFAPGLHNSCFGWCTNFWPVCSYSKVIRIIVAEFCSWMWTMTFKRSLSGHISVQPLYPKSI